MKALKAMRVKFNFGDIWVSPYLHILLSREDEIIVARCLEFTVSSHGDDEKEALGNLAEAVKEYILSAIENDAVNTIYDPVHGKYWRIFNELEAKQVNTKLKRSLKKSIPSILEDKAVTFSSEISYA